MFDYKLAGLMRPPHMAAAVIAKALAVLLVLPAIADNFCPSGTEGIVTACSAASGLPQHMLKRRIDRSIASDPARGRIDGRLSSKAPDGSAPFAMTPDGDHANFSTILMHWSAAFAAADSRGIADVDGDHLQLPKPVTPVDPDFDLWASARIEPETPDGARSKSHRAFTTYVGADYRLRSDMLVGAMVQLDSAHENVIAVPEAYGGSGYLAGPYLAYRITPNVTFDAKAAWGAAQDTALQASRSDVFVTTRSLREARLIGKWNWDNWQFSQTGSIMRAGEMSHAALPGVPGTQVDVTRVMVGPELRRKIDAGDGNLLEPFVFLKTSLDLDDSSAESALPQNMVGGGIVLSRPNEYSIRAIADYTGTTATEFKDVLSGRVAEQEALTGRVQVNVPLR